MRAISGNDLSASPVTLNAAFLTINIPSSFSRFKAEFSSIRVFHCYLIFNIYYISATLK